MGPPIVLGIESPCDETGAGLVRDGWLPGHAVAAVCAEYGVGALVVVSEGAANSRVQSLAEERCQAAGIELRVPPLRLSTDNGAVIPAVGDLLVRAGAEPALLDISIDSSAPLEHAALPPVAASAPPRTSGSTSAAPQGPHRASTARLSP